MVGMGRQCVLLEAEEWSSEACVNTQIGRIGIPGGNHLDQGSWVMTGLILIEHFAETEEVLGRTGFYPTDMMPVRF